MKKAYRLDTRRVRRVNPSGPNPEEQAKLLGSRDLKRSHNDYGLSRKALLEQALEAETQEPDMTPLPRKTGYKVFLYLPGRTILGAEIIGED